MSLDSVYMVNVTDLRPSYVVLVSAYRDYFNDRTRVTGVRETMMGVDLGGEAMRPLGPENRHLIVRFDPPQTLVDRVKREDVVTGTLVISLRNPTDTATIGVAYVDDSRVRRKN